MKRIFNDPRRILLLFAVAIIVTGGVFFLFPQTVTLAFALSPTSIVGTAEIRGLYGGGFISLGAMTLVGLSSKRLAPGLFMAVALFMWCIACARVIGLFIDHEFLFTGMAMAAEVLAGWLFWTASRKA